VSTRKNNKHIPFQDRGIKPSYGEQTGSPLAVPVPGILQCRGVQYIRKLQHVNMHQVPTYIQGQFLVLCLTSELKTLTVNW